MLAEIIDGAATTRKHLLVEPTKPRPFFAVDQLE